MAFDPGAGRKREPLNPSQVNFLCEEVDEEMDRIIQEAWEKEMEDPDFVNWYSKFGGRTE